MTVDHEPSSFRDPSGFVFYADGNCYRQVNQVYADHYTRAVEAGLFDQLIKKGLLVSHEEVDLPFPRPDLGFKVIKPRTIPFISYPYEWCFSQLKDAALLTLDVQMAALKKGFTLKDATAYNIQFLGGQPVLIDTLSLETYEEGTPWVAYRQFCQHFLAPLALMAYRDTRLNKMCCTFIDGIPLDIAASLLPRNTRMKLGLGLHLHAHAKVQQKHADSGADTAYEGTRKEMKKSALIALIDNLQSTVRKLTLPKERTEWGDYYDATNYSGDSFEEKRTAVSDMIQKIAPSVLWDLGANTGVFSRLGAELGIDTIAFDVDHDAVEKNYRAVQKEKNKQMLPLVLDLTAPSADIGWGNEERASLIARGGVDMMMALALIHHLAIGNNVPLPQCARFFARCGKSLLIEFVPKEDSQVQRMLRTREDIFPNYTQEGFLAAFLEYFDEVDRKSIPGSERTLFLLKTKV